MMEADDDDGGLYCAKLQTVMGLRTLVFCRFACKIEMNARSCCCLSMTNLRNHYRQMMKSTTVAESIAATTLPMKVAGQWWQNWLFVVHHHLRQSHELPKSSSV